MITEKKTIGKKLTTLKKTTDKGRKERSDKVHIKHITTILDAGKYIREYLYETYTETKSKYRTSIRSISPENPDLKGGAGDVIVSCSCPDFMYRWEVALAVKNAAKVKYSNGAYPKITNPKGKTSICKHLVAIAEDVLIKNSKDMIKFNTMKEKFAEYDALLKLIGRR